LGDHTTRLRIALLLDLNKTDLCGTVDEDQVRIARRQAGLASNDDDRPHVEILRRYERGVARKHIVQILLSHELRLFNKCVAAVSSANQHVARHAWSPQQSSADDSAQESVAHLGGPTLLISNGFATMLPIDTYVGLLYIWIVASPFVVVGCLKGRYALSIVGPFVLFGIPAILAGTRLARRDSWWAKRFYDEDRLARAAQRYPGHSQISDALIL
jgi:hypothetical protein